MKKEQEAKFEALWSHDITYGENDKPVARCYYEAGLRDANWIGEEPRIQEPSSAPEWVIDMVRMGKPVRCNVWNKHDFCRFIADITGYDINDDFPFNGYTIRNESEVYDRWECAEPIPAWKPEDKNVLLLLRRLSALLAEKDVTKRTYYEEMALEGIDDAIKIMSE